MWGLLKSLATLAVLAALTYAVFFLPLGESTFAGHMRDIWSSRVVEQKRDIIREALKKELEQRLLEQGAEPVHEMAGALVREGITDEDRAKLSELLEHAAD